MELSGWGNYPKIKCNVINPNSLNSKDSIFTKHNKFIPRGLGRSYGDSALSDTVILTNNLNKFIKFNSKEG